MISTRTDRENLKETFFGPNIDQDNINSYKKNSSSIRSISVSEISCKDVAKSQDSKYIEQKLHQAVMIAKLGFRSSKNNPNRGSKKYYNEQKSYKTANNFMKTLNQNQNVHRFKDNLFSSAYVLQDDQKQILQHESYLEERKGRFHRVLELNKIFGGESMLTKILMPGQKVTLIWDFISLIVYLFSLWICPMMASFGQNAHLLKGSELFINAFTFLEILITLYRPIVISGEMIKQINAIWIQYVTNQLIEDFLGISIWFMIFFNLNQQVVLNEIMALVQVIIVLRKIIRKYNNQIENLYLRGFNSNVLDLITLFILIFYFAHMMACIWFYIGYQTSMDGSWLTYYDVQDASIWVKYNYSYYWAVVTMVTVGYGDVTAKNQIEIAFVSLMVLFSSCMFAYSMNSIGVIVKNIYEQTNKIKRTLILLNKFMQKGSVDPQIQNRVKNYIKFSAEQEIMENNQETIKILNSLPAGLKIELEQNIKNNIIQRIKLFTDQFSQQTQNQVAQNLSFVKYTPQDIIYHRDERNDKNLYFISEGEVQIIEENSKKILKQLKAGDTFGEYQFFTGQNTKESTISVGFTELYKIDRDKFQGFIKQNQKDFERFHKIKDVILYQKTFSLLQEKCSFCRKFTHIPIECPLLTYQPNIYIKILKNNKSINKGGNLLRTGEKTKSLLIKYRIGQSVSEYQMHNSIIDTDQQQQDFSEQISGQFQAQVTLNENVPNLKISDQLLKSLKSFTMDQQPKSKIDLNQNIKDKERTPTIIQFLKSRNMLESNEFEKAPKNNYQQKEAKQLDQFSVKFTSIDLQQFETLRNYLDYLPQNNVQNVLRLVNREKPKLRQIHRLTKGRSFGISLYSPSNQV